MKLLHSKSEANSYWGGCSLPKNLLGLFLLIALAFFGPVVNAQNPPTHQAQQPHQIEEPGTTATIQIPFWTTVFEASSNDVLATVLKDISLSFGHLKLNTVGRGLHSTMLYLDNLTLEETREIVEFFENIPTSILEEYGLNRRFKVLDPNDIRLHVVGTKSRFIAIAPHEEMVQWQMSFWRMIQNHLPKYYERHRTHGNLGEAAVSAEGVHISLVQFGERFGIPLTEAQVLEVQESLKHSIENAFRKTGQTAVWAGLDTHGIEVILPPRAIAEKPLTVYSFGLNGEGKKQTGRFVRWREKTTNQPSQIDPLIGENLVNEVILEYPVESFVQGRYDKSADVRSKSESSSWTPVFSRYQAFSKEAALGQVGNSHLIPLVEKYLDPWVDSTAPASRSGPGGRQVYFASETHPFLDPSKGHSVSDYFRILGFNRLRNQELFTSDAIYASGVRGDIANPSDYDLLESVLIRVPPEVTLNRNGDGYQFARKYVASIVGATVMRRLRELIFEGRISLIELRIGSDATMGNGSDLPFLKRFQENPYLRESDLIRGYYKDSKGKTWSLEDLISLGDFIKSKIDLFVEGRRIPLSLQFFIGFEWGPEGARRISSLHTDGVKGVPPLMRTAVYQDMDSYLTSLLMRRPDTLARVQRGDVVPFAIRDLQSSLFKDGQVTDGIVLYSKFMKRMLNTLLLLARSGQRLDLLFAEPVFKELGIRFEGDTSISNLVLQIRRSINQPILGELGGLKQVAVDFYEFAEAKAFFTSESVFFRLNELRTGVDRLIAQLEIMRAPPELSAQLLEYRDLFKEVDGLSLGAINQRIVELLDKHKQFEKLLYKIEGKAIQDPSFSSAAVDPEVQRVLVHFAKKIPDLYLDFHSARRFVSGAERGWIREFMGVQTQPQERLPEPSSVVFGCRGLFAS